MKKMENKNIRIFARFYIKVAQLKLWMDENCIVYYMSLCFILSCSCQGKIDDNLLLHGYEYKLWYIDNECKDSLEWNDLDTVKLKSFWTECEYEWGAYYQYDYDSEYVYYIRTTYTEIEKLRRFKKKRNIPEFLYIDRDGYICVLTLDRWTGDFVEKPDAELTGYWKLKNDAIMMINDKRYSVRRIENNPAAVQITNLKTGDKLKIMDACFPPGLNGYEIFPSGRSGQHEINWTEENDRVHHKKWGYGIKQSPFLQGHDCKLWRHEKNHGFYNPNEMQAYEAGHDFIERYYYYCSFMYLDKYGRYTKLYLTGDRWNMWESYCDEIHCDDLIYIYDWRPNGNDSILCGDRTVQILHSNEDTLHLRDLDTNENLRYIAVNLPPKSKSEWQKNRKRR